MGRACASPKTTDCDSRLGGLLNYYERAAWPPVGDERDITAADHAFVQALMAGRLVDRGKFANWIAPPRVGINNQPLDFEYVRFNSVPARRTCGAPWAN